MGYSHAVAHILVQSLVHKREGRRVHRYTEQKYRTVTSSDKQALAFKSTDDWEATRLTCCGMKSRDVVLARTRGSSKHDIRERRMIPIGADSLLKEVPDFNSSSRIPSLFSQLTLSDAASYFDSRNPAEWHTLLMQPYLDRSSAQAGFEGLVVICAFVAVWPL